MHVTPELLERIKELEAEVERLREIESCPSGYVNISKAVYANLRAEVARLKTIVQHHAEWPAMYEQQNSRNLERAEAAEADLRDIIENDEGQRERANKLEAEVARLREALSGLLESPASFEDSRLDYAERQVDTKAWDEARAALAAPVEEPKP